MALVSDLNPLLTNAQSLILTGSDAVNASIYNILFTSPGSRRFFPTYGLGIENILGTNFNQISPVYYQTKISNAINKWEKRALSVKVRVTFNTITSIMSITINYNYISQNIVLPSSFIANIQT